MSVPRVFFNRFVVPHRQRIVDFCLDFDSHFEIFVGVATACYLLGFWPLYVLGLAWLLWFLSELAVFLWIDDAK